MLAVLYRRDNYFKMQLVMDIKQTQSRDNILHGVANQACYILFLSFSLSLFFFFCVIRTRLSLLQCISSKALKEVPSEDNISKKRYVRDAGNLIAF
jgi:hypothetical protein